MQTSFLFAFAFVGLSLLSSLVSCEPRCSAKFGTAEYNLNQLAEKFKSDQVTTGSAGNTYYYRPCKVLENTDCTNKDSQVAVCQKDQRVPPDYHSIGSYTDESWSELTPTGTGIQLIFMKGENNYKSNIKYICESGDGEFKALDPTFLAPDSFNFEWRTQFACAVYPHDGGDGGGHHHHKDDNGGLVAATVIAWLLVCFLLMAIGGSAVLAGFLAKRLLDQGESINVKDFFNL